MSQVVKAERVHSGAANSISTRDHAGDINKGTGQMRPYETGSKAVN